MRNFNLIQLIRCWSKPVSSPVLFAAVGVVCVIGAIWLLPAWPSARWQVVSTALQEPSFIILLGLGLTVVTAMSGCVWLIVRSARQRTVTERSGARPQEVDAALEEVFTEASLCPQCRARLIVSKPDPSSGYRYAKCPSCRREFANGLPTPEEGGTLEGMIRFPGMREVSFPRRGQLPPFVPPEGEKET